MPTLHPDVDGSARQTKDGRWEYERVHVVEGATGTGYARARNACQVSGMPAVGDLHPDDGDAILEEIVPHLMPGHSHDFRVTLVYRTPIEAAPRITIGSSLTEEEADTDVNGALMELDYTDKNGNEHTQVVTTPVGRPLSTIVIETVEAESPGAKSRTYVGALNQAGWSLDSPAAARTWRCDEITGTSDDGGATFHVRYVFEYKADTWDARAAYIDTATGRMPDDIDGNASAPDSRKRFQMDAELDFDAIPGL